MLPRNGGGGPKSGKKLPEETLGACRAPDYTATIARALRQGVGSGGGAAKQLERWTGASNRTVRGWLSGARGPSGEHLVLLARRSDAVLEALMALVFQPGQSGEDVVDTARRLIATALVTLDRREKRDVSGRSRKGSG
jgi:hypothetical protein